MPNFWIILLYLLLGATPYIIRDIFGYFKEIKKLRYEKKLTYLVEAQDKLLKIFESVVPNIPILDEQKLKDYIYNLYGNVSSFSDTELLQELEITQRDFTKTMKVFLSNRHLLSKNFRKTCDYEYEKFWALQDRTIVGLYHADREKARQSLKYFRAFSGLFFLGIIKACEETSDKLG